MFTRCPDCQTLFRVRAEILRAAHGQVRCGRCGLQFNALDSLAEDPESLARDSNGAPEDPVTSIIDEAQTAEAEWQDSDPSISGQTPSEAVEDATAGDEYAVAADPQELSEGASIEPQDDPHVVETESEIDAGATPASHAAQTSGQPLGLSGLTSEDLQTAWLNEEPNANWGLRIAAASAVLLLLSALLVQWLYMQRVPLYAQPEFRPVLQRLCGLLNCELPLPRKPEQIEVLERVVREHPRVAKALLVDLTFVSRAAEPIAYPLVELRLADVSGNRVMGRQFTPMEYLSATARHRVGLSPNQPLHITLELIAPVTPVVSFQFDFL